MVGTFLEFKMAGHYGSTKVTYVKIENMENTEKSSEDNLNDITEDNVSEFSEMEEMVLNKYKQIVIGAILSLLSGTLFTVNNFLIKKFSIDVSDVLIVRSILQICIISAIIYIRGDRLLPRSYKEQFFTIGQGLAGAITLISSLTCMSFIPLPDVLCIMIFYPLVTLLLTTIILGDTLTSLKCFSGTLLFIGVFLVSQPSFLFQHSSWAPSLQLVTHPGMYGTGVTLAVVASTAGAIMTIAIAKCQTLQTTVLFMWTAICSLPIAIIINLLQTESCILSPSITNISVTGWLFLFGLSFSGFLAFALLVQSIKLLSPILVSSLTTMEVVLAYIAQLLLTEKYPDSWAGVGMVMLVGGLVIITSHDQIVNMWTVREATQYGELEEHEQHERLVPYGYRQGYQNVTYTYIQ